MADKYDSNGDYNNYSGSNSSDFKRKNTNEIKEDTQDGDTDDANPSSQKAAEYVRELLSEKISLDQGKWPNAARLIDQGLCTITIYINNNNQQNHYFRGNSRTGYG